jgi:hypothetical protein
MLKLMRDPTESILLADLGVLRIKGADADRFLQGQLSNDMQEVVPGHALLAGYHNPQGRTIAILRLVRSAHEEILAILPRELAASVAARLAKFILRAKVNIENVSDSLRVEGLVVDAAAPSAAPADAGLARIAGAPPRWLRITAAAAAVSRRDERQHWRGLDIASGEPQVYAATSEEFVAQMLNLDALGAIAFDKGCYTGQEVIARAHYRGRVKRRMQRFVTPSPQELVPGTAGRFSDGRTFKVVDALRRSDGYCEFLAVTALGTREEAPSESALAPIEASPLPLPYPLPE